MSTATVLAREVARLAAVGRLTGVHAVYIFGSSLTALEPRDIDLLVVWDESQLNSGDALALRPILAAALSGSDSAPIDITLLSRAEVRSSRFVELESAELLYSAVIP